MQKKPPAQHHPTLFENFASLDAQGKREPLLAASRFHSILCLDGDLPSPDFFQTELSALPIFAADGAANTLQKMGIRPQLVIGDLDSLAPDLKTTLPTLLWEDQNLCDFQKSLLSLQEQALLPALIVGVHGGYLDHVLNNVNLFLKTNGVLYAPPLIGFVMQASERRHFAMPLNTKISLLAIPAATVSTRGLKWELSDSDLSFPGNNSCFNRTERAEIEIHVTTGSVLILVYALLTTTLGHSQCLL